jgi:hypothetical protein
MVLEPEELETAERLSKWCVSSIEDFSTHSGYPKRTAPRICAAAITGQPQRMVDLARRICRFGKYSSRLVSCAPSITQGGAQGFRVELQWEALRVPGIQHAAGGSAAVRSLSLAPS